MSRAVMRWRRIVTIMTYILTMRLGNWRRRWRHLCLHPGTATRVTSHSRGWSQV